MGVKRVGNGVVGEREKVGEMGWEKYEKGEEERMVGRGGIE